MLKAPRIVWVLRVFIPLMFLVAVLVGNSSNSQQSPSKNEPPAHEDQRGGNEQKLSYKGDDNSRDRPSIFDFLSRDGIQRIASYCKAKGENEPDKWLHDKFICDVHATDVVISVFTGILVFVGLLQLFLFFRQLKFIRKGLIDTKHAADAAKVSAKAALEQVGQNRLVERAYLSAEPHGVAPIEAGAHADAHVGFRNAGRMPASDVEYFINMEMSSNGNLQEFAPDNIVSKFVIPPGTEMKQHGRSAFSADQIECFRGNACWLFVWGEVTYLDGFGVKRFTRFCHRYDARGFAIAKDGLYKGKGVIYVEGARYHKYGNDAD